jgi:imidazolonepropionase-like amidohydrolase
VAPPGEDAAAVPTLFAGVRVFDGTGDASSGPFDVGVEGGRIRRIAEPGALDMPPGAVRVEGAGRTLMPGLWDSHVHLGSGEGEAPWALGLADVHAQAAALLYCGVTTAVSAGREVDTALLNAEFTAGRAAGPRLLRASRPITANGGHPLSMFRLFVGWPLADLFVSAHIRQAASPEEAREAVRAEVASSRGPQLIKVVYNAMVPGTPHLTRAALDAVVDEARRFGRRTGVHVGTPAEAVEAAQAGAAVLMHTPWDGALTGADLEQVRARGTAVVTTRRIFHASAAAQAGVLSFSALEREVMKPGLDARWGAPPKDYPPKGAFAEFARELARYDRELGENVARLRAAGVTVLVGTDSGVPGQIHGGALHEELKALVALGYTPAEALRTATSVPARVWAADAPDAARGVIAEGAVADLMLVEGDPAARIEDLSRIVGIWQEGRAVDRRVPGRAK